MSLLPTPSTSSPSLSPGKLSIQIGVAALGRLFLNTARRFPYPFAPLLGLALGVSLPAITSLIAINQITGIAVIFLGPFIDYWGYRLVMITALTMLGVGLLLVGFWPVYGAVLIALLLAGLAKSIFDPALQAYIGQQVPYHRRGMAIGFAEMSWSGSSLIGIPMVGFLIAYWGWQSPFVLMGCLTLVIAVILIKLIPPPPPPPTSPSPMANRPSIGIWRQLIRQPAVIGILSLGFFTSAANDNLFVVYGAWLSGSFGLATVALGIATTTIGIAELSGESITAFTSDRFGLRRTIITASLLSVGSYLILPLFNSTLPFALAGLFLVFICVEITIVTGFSLCTEIVPQARATLLSGYVAAASLGRAGGAFLGGISWANGEIVSIGLVSALIAVLGVILFWWGLRGWQPHPQLVLED